MLNGMIAWKIAVFICILGTLSCVAAAEEIKAANITIGINETWDGQGQGISWNQTQPANETGFQTGINSSITEMPGNVSGNLGPGHQGVIEIINNESSSTSENSGDEILIAPLPDESQVSDVFGTETLITTGNNGFDKTNPKISGHYIVWQALDNNNNYNIYLYDLMSGNQTLVTPSTDYSDQSSPAISGNRIVFEDTRNGKSDIYLFDLDTGNTTRLTDETGNQKTPDISGDWVVWQDERDGNYLICLYNIPSGVIQTISGNLSYQQLPSIHGNIVVWEDWRNGNFDIYSYNITSSEELQVTSRPEDEQSPDVFEDRIVYEVKSPEGYAGIGMFNLATGKEIAITNSSWDHQVPKISGDLIVWQDRRNYFDIYGYNTGTNTFTLITPGNPESAQLTPVIDGERIAWADTRNAVSEIYLITLGTQKQPLIPGFSADLTMGVPPLPVHFTGNSTGDVETWTWDFGDGTGSREQNPNHTYQQHGLYPVSLTVSNPYQRSEISRNAFIAAGSPPAALFEANPASGAVPVSIMFNDTSTGYPDNWKWNFGDGYESDEQNPVHVFESPGTYTVTLTVKNIFGSSSKTNPSMITGVRNLQDTETIDIPGLQVSADGPPQSLILNTSEMGEYQVIDPWNSTEIVIIPRVSKGIQYIALFPDMNGFSYDGTIITGNITAAHISGIMNATDLPDIIQRGCSFSFEADTDRINPDETYKTIMWAGVIPDDYKKYEQVVLGSGYAGIGGSAFTVRFIGDEQAFSGPASITMSVSKEWVMAFGQKQGAKPEEDTVKILRKGDDGAVEILNTTFTGIDPSTNVEYFRAESPHGLSTFTLATLTGTGNPLQLAYLSVSSRASGGGGGGGGYSGSANPSTSQAADTEKSSPHAATDTGDNNAPEKIVTGTRETGPVIQSTPEPDSTFAGPGVPVDAVAATSQAPGTTIFTILVQAAAMVSVVLIVVFSVYLRYRKPD